MSSGTLETSSPSQELTASLADWATTAERLLEASRQFNLSEYPPRGFFVCTAAAPAGA